MELLYQTQSVLIGLIGWAATVLVLMNATRLTVNDRRMMLICSWMVWMIPSMGALVYRGLISTNTAAFYVAGTTLGMAAIVVASALLRTRTRP